MKSIILAGGTGSRLYPVSKVVNKHLLPVFNKPMIYYPIMCSAKAGLNDIIIVSDKDYLEDYRKLLSEEGLFKNIHFNFVAQKQAGGIAQALGFCKKLVGNEKIAVILGDNIFTEDFTGAVKSFAEQERGAKFFLKEVERPGRFEIAIFENDDLTGIQEKPLSPKSNYAITGLYLYDTQVWNIIEGLRPSVRGELEITDVNNYYIKQGTATYEILNEDWFDVDTFSALNEATGYFAKTNV